jgi:nitrite reductase/ring-hydroxylating ferredoxin subunit
MLVYLAYVALVLHLALGVVQDEQHPLYLGLLIASVLGVGGLHLAAAIREVPGDRAPAPGPDWVDVGAAGSIAEGRAIVGMVAGERVAVFRDRDRLSCVSNFCKHQNGPLGVGKIIDGCITCPWHGYQYRPDSGTSPPPFNDSIPTFNLAVREGRVLVDPKPNPPGTRVEPVPAGGPGREAGGEFYVGYAPTAPPHVGRFTRLAATGALIVSVSAMVGLALAQRRYGSSTYEFGRGVTITGVVRTDPYPILEVVRPGRDAGVSRYLLAAAGKRGAQAVAAGFDGRAVNVNGSLAYRGNLTLLEITAIDPATAPAGPAPARTGTLASLGTFGLVGEIVDSKCYGGVMNPGTGKTHRACAARCLSGGLTPLLAIRDAAGGELEMVVLDREGRPFPEAARWAGRPVSVRGRVSRLDDLWFIRVEDLTEAR